MMRKLLIMTAVAVLSLASCNKDDETIPESDLIPRADFTLTKAQAAFVQANNGFALDLFGRVSRAGQGKSLLLSPLSITLDFGMVNNGAVGKTQQEIYETLGFQEGSVDALNEFCHTMMVQSAAVDPSTTLELANAAVVNKRYPGLKDSFTKTIRQVYDAEVIYKDFGKENIQKLVNDWCKTKTHGMIPELLADPVDPNEYAHFLNAVYFKGIWSSKFKKEDSRKEDFVKENGSSIKVNMMHQVAHFNYAEIPGVCSAVRLPYGNQAYNMTLLLPSAGKTLKDLVAALDLKTWQGLRLSDCEVDVKLPSFETSYFVSLAGILQEMGIVTAFSGAANFSALSSASGLYIGDVLHKAAIKVDESGSEAAAVTDIVMKTNSAQPPKTVQFYANKPFLYIISEISTGAIFFMGQYTGE